MLDWSKYITVADKLQHKAKYQDREDLNHTIILSLADAQIRLDNDGGGQLSDIAMLRIGSYECQRYWRQQKRLLTILSLNTVIDDRTFLLGCPMRLIVIAGKRLKGIPLNNADKLYLGKWRKREQKRLSESCSTKTGERCQATTGG